MKLINTTEDLFHRDIGDESALTDFMKNIINQNKTHIFKLQIDVTRERDEDNNYVLHTKVGIFKSIESARKLFVDITDSQEPIRQEARAWNQQHKILTKAEIVNVIDRKPVRQLLNCLTATCERFGGKCNEETGCSTVTFAQEYVRNKKPFPIKVMVG